MQEVSVENKETEPKKEDQVAEDIEEAKTFLHKLTRILKESAAPLTGKSKESSEVILGSAQSLLKKDLFRKILRIFFIIFFLLILILVGSKIFQALQQNGQEQEVSQQGPTTAPFSPYRPSVYAEDLEILSLEQDINVLEREVSRANLREDGLLPPKLDFDISFED